MKNQHDPEEEEQEGNDLPEFDSIDDPKSDDGDPIPKDPIKGKG